MVGLWMCGVDVGYQTRTAEELLQGIDLSIALIRHMKALKKVYQCIQYPFSSSLTVRRTTFPDPLPVLVLGERIHTS